MVVGLLVSAASGSIGLATNVSGVGLRVDAFGDAQITWTKAGVKHTLLVTRSGAITHGALVGRDVSKAAHVAGLPSAVVLRSTAGGNLWAVQLTAPGAGKPVSLDFSHWHGAPTELKLSTDGKHLQGSVSFAGKPVTGYSSSPYGLKPKIYVFVDCFGCGGKSAWSLILGVAPSANGSFSVLLRPAWKGSRYRATVVGPNRGTVYAPDAVTVIPA